MLPPLVASTSPSPGPHWTNGFTRAPAIGDLGGDDHLVGVWLEAELLAGMEAGGVLIFKGDRRAVR